MFSTTVACPFNPLSLTCLLPSLVLEPLAVVNSLIFSFSPKVSPDFSSVSETYSSPPDSLSRTSFSFTLYTLLLRDDVRVTLTFRLVESGREGGSGSGFGGSGERILLTLLED